MTCGEYPSHDQAFLDLLLERNKKTAIFITLFRSVACVDTICWVSSHVYGWMCFFTGLSFRSTGLYKRSLDCHS